MIYSLRLGNLADVEVVYRLNREIFSEYWSRASLFSALESGYDVLLCEVDGMPVAYLLSLTVLDEIQIMQVAVAAASRRQGLARRMTESLMDAATGMNTVTLEVRQSNQAAQQLYAGLGFESVGCRKKYYSPDISGHREDAILMTKHLRV